LFKGKGSSLPFTVLGMHEPARTAPKEIGIFFGAREKGREMFPEM